MSQIALPLRSAPSRPARIVIGSANARAVEALASPGTWPFCTAVLTGAPRSGKSLLAQWFASRGEGKAIDDARALDEAEVFHRWNRAQESGTPLLIVGGEPPWPITLPDLRSRMGAALQLEIGLPDDAMAADLVLAHAEQRDLPLGPDAVDYLAPRSPRSFAGIERLVGEIDRLSLERMAPVTHSLLRAALEVVLGPEEPRLL